jgi:hypothetical protein
MTGNVMSRTCATVVGLLVLSGCAMHSTDSSLLLEVYWDAAHECEGRYGTLRVERVSNDGDLSVRAAADSQSEVAAFRECYRQGLQQRLERRRAEGRPVPDDVNTNPSVEVD